MVQSFDLNDIPNLLQTWGNNFTRNTGDAFRNLTAKDAIRLVIIIGAYALIIRPILVKIGVKIQSKQHEEANKEAEEQAKLSANTLRGRVAIPGVESDSESDEETKGHVTTGQWGRKARLRQRNMIRNAIETKEKRSLGEESDEELKDLLED